MEKEAVREGKKFTTHFTEFSKLHNSRIGDVHLLWADTLS